MGQGAQADGEVAPVRPDVEVESEHGVGATAPGSATKELATEGRQAEDPEAPA
jgi:hypothetical protein